MFRASQYDHTVDDYIKKKLSQRMFFLSGGQSVQRDWYSSFLLYCAGAGYDKPDRELCMKCFDRMMLPQKPLVKKAVLAVNKISGLAISIFCLLGTRPGHFCTYGEAIPAFFLHYHRIWGIPTPALPKSEELTKV